MEDAKKETQHLINCLKRLNPTWKYKEFQDALHKSQTSISFLMTGKQSLRPDAQELARRLIADRIAELTGDQYSYFQVQKIAKYYEDIQRGKEFSSLDGSAPPIEYKIAQTIARRGVAIP